MYNSRNTKLLMVLILIFSSKYIFAESAEKALVKSCNGLITSKIIPEDSICYEYISGFIDGAVITDTAIVENITKEKTEFSSFFNRAYKTRVGISRDKVPATFYANFCLPEDQTRKMVIEELIHELDSKAITKQAFKISLYDTLKRVYKC